MEEVLTAARNGELKEVFGTGTAAVVSPVQSLTFRGETLQLPDPAGFEVCNFVRNTLADIRLGKVSDERDWVSVIC
jgi:branched-chain amino acid aminotransferase